MENAWQFTKIYSEYVDENDEPSKGYFEWAQKGWNDNYAHCYPQGKNRKPLYSYWDGKKLGYIEARKQIYAPLYAAVVENTCEFAQLKELYNNESDLWLKDFDGYDFRYMNMLYSDVIHNPSRKMGHAFVNNK